MLLHHHVIDLIRAVVHDAENSHGFGKILGRFSLTGSGGASRIRTKLDVEGTCDRNPALVSERCDNETSCSSHVFISVEEHGLNLSNDALELRVTLNLLISVPQLLLPVEVVDTCAVFLSELIDNVTRVHILSNQSCHNGTFKVAKITSDKLCQFLEPIIVLLEPLIE